MPELRGLDTAQANKRKPHGIVLFCVIPRVLRLHSFVVL